MIAYFCDKCGEETASPEKIEVGHSSLFLCPRCRYDAYKAIAPWADFSFEEDHAKFYDNEKMSNVEYRVKRRLFDGDSIKIVRCRDCKHRDNSLECSLAFDAREHGGCYHMSEQYDDWFCADGERKIEEDHDG